MNPKIPHSPFTTRLSGSAKETELRLRNIFQWKKKRPPIVLFILTAVLVLSCCGLVSCQVQSKPNTTITDPIIINNRSYVPLETIAKANGYQVIANKASHSENNQSVVEYRYEIKKNDTIIADVSFCHNGYEIYSIMCGQGFATFSEAPVAERFAVHSGIVYVLEEFFSEHQASTSSSSLMIAPLEGNAVSPDGKYEVRLYGVTEDIMSSGIFPAESVQIHNIQTGDILWQIEGLYTHAASWSPDGRYLALSRTARTYCIVTIIDTKTWTSWDVTLPDGGPIPEYIFLPENQSWAHWTGENSLYLTVGRDPTTQKTYHCVLHAERNLLEGHTLACEVNTLVNNRDFDHDGIAETVNLMTMRTEDGVVSWHDLQIQKATGTVLWSATAHTSHAGWISLFACSFNNEDYILRYYPTMYQGFCGYSYQLFSLDANGNEVVHRENSIEFDLNWDNVTNPYQPHTFDANIIADFMDEVNSLLEQSKLLITTDYALSDIDPEHPQDNLYWLNDDYSHWGYTYDESKTVRENLQALEKATSDN